MAPCLKAIFKNKLLQTLGKLKLVLQQEGAIGLIRNRKTVGKNFQYWKNPKKNWMQTENRK